MSGSGSGTKRTILAACVAALAVTCPSLAETARPPAATLTVPPPEPPPRPAELNPELAAPPLVPPRPPERPEDLTVGAAKPLPPEPAPARPGPGEASATAADAPPSPPARPAELGGTAPLTVTVAPSETPLPPERPADLVPEGETLAEPAPRPPERPTELSGEAASPAVLAVPEDTACLKRLDAIGVSYEKQPTILNGQCSVPHPIELRSIAADEGKSAVASAVALSADQTVVCSVAEALGLWTKDAKAAADKELGDRLTGLTLGGGYVCRGQNHVTEAKLSEHAFGNAIDVMGFTFAKRSAIAVGTPPENSPEAKFLDSVRASACRHFRTVLGPGSNEAHANHLHFDQRERAGGHRLCELRPTGPDPKQSANVKP